MQNQYFLSRRPLAIHDRPRPTRRSLVEMVREWRRPTCPICEAMHPAETPRFGGPVLP